MANNKEAIDEMYDVLATFLKSHSQSIEGEEINLVVHQFGFTILYLPVYLVL